MIPTRITGLIDELALPLGRSRSSILVNLSLLTSQLHLSSNLAARQAVCDLLLPRLAFLWVLNIACM